MARILLAGLLLASTGAVLLMGGFKALSVARLGRRGGPAMWILGVLMTLLGMAATGMALLQLVRLKG